MNKCYNINVKILFIDMKMNLEYENKLKRYPKNAAKWFKKFLNWEKAYLLNLMYIDSKAIWFLVYECFNLVPRQPVVCGVRFL